MIFFTLRMSEYVGGFDHCDIDAQSPCIISKNTGAEADELYFHMPRQFPEQIEHMCFCSSYITAVDYVNYLHIYLHRRTAAFLRQSVSYPVSKLLSLILLFPCIKECS